MNHLVLVLFALTMLYASVTLRLEAHVRLLAVQGFLLFLTVALETASFATFTFLFLALETLVFKTVLIPWILLRTMRKLVLRREDEPYLMNFHTLLFTILIFVFSFALAFAAKPLAAELKSLHFAVSVATILGGLFIIMRRKKIVTHILGFIFMENGIFLLSLAAAQEMPLIVNLGVLLDIFIAIFLLLIALRHIHAEFDEIHIDELRNLTD